MDITRPPLITMRLAWTGQPELVADHLRGGAGRVGLEGRLLKLELFDAARRI
jgi:hypothetical protein